MGGARKGRSFNMPKGAIKKTKKKKNSEKNKRLEPQTESHHSQDQLLSCVGQLIGWLGLYQKQLAAAVAEYEQPQPGLSLWTDLMLCLTTMRAPVTASGLSLLQPLVDNSGLVAVSSLYSDLLICQQRLTLEKTERKEESELCATCGLRLPPPPYSDPCHSYVELQLVLASFTSCPAHPGHMTFLLPASTTIEAIQHQLHSSLGAMTTTVSIFSEVKVQRLNHLSPHSSLLDVGVAGGTKTTPTKATLYYDYIPVSVSCPIIMADHNFYHPP